MRRPALESERHHAARGEKVMRIRIIQEFTLVGAEMQFFWVGALLGITTIFVRCFGSDLVLSKQTRKVAEVPKILVLYHSNSGNTLAMAQLVAEGAGQLDGAEVRLKDVSAADHTDLDWCDGIALGSPTNYGSVSWQMKRWWDEQPLENWGKRDGKIGCVFTSAGAWGGGQEWTSMTLLSILINYGFLVFGLTDYTGIKFSAHYGAICAGAPREDHVREACRRLGLRLAEWTACLIEGRKEAHPLKQTYDRFEDLGK